MLDLMSPIATSGRGSGPDRQTWVDEGFWSERIALARLSTTPQHRANIGGAHILAIPLFVAPLSHWEH
jgi:hypothetical protein